MLLNSRNLKSGWLTEIEKEGDVNYIKPNIKSYTADGILEELGPGQTQYTVTLNTRTGEIGGDIDGFIYYEEGTYTVNTNGEDPDDPSEPWAILIGAEEEDDFVARGFVGFDISSIQSTVVSARLKIYQGIADESPYTTTGNLLVDHVNFGASLDTDNFSGNTLVGNIGTLSNNVTLEWKPDTTGLDVTQYVQNDLDSGRSYSQFRLHFTTEDGVGVVGYAAFCDSEGHYGDHTPVLVITYY